MVDILMDPWGKNVVGRVGENDHRRLVFDVKETMEMYPDAGFSIVFRRPGDEAGYPVPDLQLAMEDGKLCWVMSSGDLARRGEGQCEVIAADSGVIAKSEIYAVWVADAVDDDEDPPEPWEGWVTEVTEAAAAAAGSVTEAAGYAQDASGSAQAAEQAAAAAEAVAQTYGMHGTVVSGSDYRLAVGAE